MPDQIPLARAIAIVAHGNAVDKAGAPYINHPARVADRVSIEATPIAWLHDVLEDTTVTVDDLRNAGVEHRVLHAVQLLTRTDTVDGDAYYRQIRNHDLALEVKLADIADNTDPRRLRLLDEPTQLRLIKKYAKALAALKGEL